ncbi:MAG: hypothetical protein Q7R96_04230 [Nanoarchaeota archaeon]|nr:hypothetical protein [Nanoarchaeota archaeon]
MTIERIIQTCLENPSTKRNVPTRGRVMDATHFSNKNYLGAYLLTRPNIIIGKIYSKTGTIEDPTNALTAIQDHMTQRYQGLYPVFYEMTTHDIQIRFRAQLQLPQ